MRFFCLSAGASGAPRYVVPCQISGRQKKNEDPKARDVDFLLKDLFMGLKGQVESSSKPPEAVHIELLE